jgi:hypothetical protein
LSLVLKLLENHVHAWAPRNLHIPKVGRHGLGACSCAFLTLLYLWGRKRTPMTVLTWET